VIASEQGTLILEFTRYDGPGDGEGPSRVIRNPILGATELDIMAQEARSHGYQPPAIGIVEDGDPTVGQGAKGLGSELDVAVNGDVGDVQEPYRDDFSARSSYGEPFSLSADHGPLFGDIYGCGVVPGGDQPPHLLERLST
jgi:hypothetical protein